MKRARKRLAQILPVALLTVIAATGPVSAGEDPKPLSAPSEVAALAAKLGDDRTGGVYYEDGRPVITVTDEAAARAVREAGGTPRLVARSAAELTSIHRKLDQLEGISNTSWGIEARTNQVSVEIFDGVPAASQARIKKVAAAEPGAIRIDRIHSKLKFKADIRGGNGITSEGWICSAGFNAKNSAGVVYALTAGHCVPGTGNIWYMNANGTEVGPQTAYNFGTGTSGYCDSSTRACDWASIRADGADIYPFGMVRFRDGTFGQITDSRYPSENEHISRIGVMSQDLTGNVTKNAVTVTIDGKSLYGMFEVNNCALGGDSGGPAFNGTTALGLLSGGTAETTCTSSSSGTYRNYFTKVQTVLTERGLKVY